MKVISYILIFSSVQLLSRVRLFATPWITARQASLSITNSQSLLKLMSIESVMPSSHLILYRPLLLLPPIPPSIRVFPNESTLRMRWPKYWSFSFSISRSNEYPGLISFTRSNLECNLQPLMLAFYLEAFPTSVLDCVSLLVLKITWKIRKFFQCHLHITNDFFLNIWLLWFMN